jgi:hypothetical protein
MQSNTINKHIHVISDREYDDKIVLTACGGSTNRNEGKIRMLLMIWKVPRVSRWYGVKAVFISYFIASKETLGTILAYKLCYLEILIIHKISQWNAHCLSLRMVEKLIFEFRPETFLSPGLHREQPILNISSSFVDHVVR